jgi:hypothetical protein
LGIYEIAKPNKPVNSQIFFEEFGCSLFVEDDKWYVGGAESQAQADAFIEAHIVPAPQEPTIQDKLASVGLSLDELRAALGGN